MRKILDIIKDPFNFKKLDVRLEDCLGCSFVGSCEKYHKLLEECVAEMKADIKRNKIKEMENDYMDRSN